jgi:hypothetical protein
MYVCACHARQAISLQAADAYVCIFIYVYMCVLVQAMSLGAAGVYVCTFMYVCMYVRMYLCVCVFAPLDKQCHWAQLVCTYVYPYMYTSTHTSKHTNV